MKKQGWLPEKGISADMIKDWLRANPERAQEVMEQNPSYAYFRQLKTQQPLGAQGVELTDRHSLAVDKRFIPLGVPVFVDTSINESPKYRGEKFRKLMIAQDTGGAIKGPIRADIFFGAGEEAAERASVMNANGAMYLLLPK
jgi:membrane-bound lytic murein transglycosylase A